MDGFVVVVVVVDSTVVGVLSVAVLSTLVVDVVLCVVTGARGVSVVVVSGVVVVGFVR